MPYILGAPEFVNRSFLELYEEGVPAVTLFIAGSDGPATANPSRDDGAAQPGAPPLAVSPPTWRPRAHRRACARRSPGCGRRLPLIETDGATLRLGPRVTVDVWEAEALAARIAANPDESLEGGHHELLMLEPLPDWDDDWAERARAGLGGRFLRALDGYARRLASRGDRFRALAVARNTWESDPLHESSAGVLIEIHLADGNQWQALSVYYALERDLAASGLGPSQALRALVAPLLRGRPRS